MTSPPTRPTVTVIIPTYNREAYLRASIASVLGQTFSDLELLVVDDGSTDDTPGLVRSIDDRRVRYLPQEHRGVSAALNAGMRSAAGRYVARLDSDDTWLPHALATLVSVLDSQPNVGVVYGKGQAMDRDGAPLPHTQGLPPRFPDDSLRSLAYDDCTCNVALLARRECLERAGGYDETLTANEDWDMWLRVARHDSFAFVDEVLALIRWHDGNLTGPASPLFAAVLDTRTAPLDKLFAAPDLPASLRAMRALAYTNVYLFRGQRWMQQRRWDRARREFGRAWRGSEERVRTLLRIFWLGFLAPALRPYRMGRYAIDAIAHARRRWARGVPE